MLELGENDEDAGGGTDGGEPHTRSHEPASDGGAGAENGGFAEEAQGSQPLSQSDGGTD